jgi:RNA recognition motif-containing protein
MGTLFMTNIPHNCTDTELRDWVQSSDIAVKRLRMIRDIVAGVSPSFAYVEIADKTTIADAVRRLNGRNIRERVIAVSEAKKRAVAAA